MAIERNYTFSGYDPAEAVAEHVRQGDPLLVTGRLFQREYERRDGSKGASLEMEFPTVAKVIKAARSTRTDGPQSAPATDPWTTPPTTDTPPL